MRATRTHSNVSRSYEPTVSGFSQMPEDRDRENKGIVVEDPDQYEILRGIQKIDSICLNPWGRLPETRDPRTNRFVWQRRTAENIWPVVWCRINQSARDVLFEVQLSRDEYCTAHVPLDSWRRRTCDPEAVRAAIQQDYLNYVRGVRHYTTIVRQGMKSLPLFQPIPVPPFETGESVDDERRQYRAQRSRPPVSSPSYVPRRREVYGHHHGHRSHDTLEPYSPAQTLVDEWPQPPRGYSRRPHYQTPHWGSRSSHSLRIFVQEDWTYDDYSDTSSSTGRRYPISPPPFRSGRHSGGLAPSSRSDSGGSSIYSAVSDELHPRERRRWWQRFL